MTLETANGVQIANAKHPNNPCAIHTPMLKKDIIFALLFFGQEFRLRSMEPACLWCDKKRSLPTAYMNAVGDEADMMCSFSFSSSSIFVNRNIVLPLSISNIAFWSVCRSLFMATMEFTLVPRRLYLSGESPSNAGNDSVPITACDPTIFPFLLSATPNASHDSLGCFNCISTELSIAFNFQYSRS